METVIKEISNLTESNATYFEKLGAIVFYSKYKNPVVELDDHGFIKIHELPALNGKQLHRLTSLLEHLLSLLQSKDKHE